jgi:GxxExxY protein
MLIVKSPLDDATERLVTQIIGCALAVHRQLGPGLLESIYRRAIAIELAEEGCAFGTEKPVPVMYRGQLLCQQRLDIVVEGAVLLEIKAVERLAPIHHAQVLSYLRISRSLRIGLLMNFNTPALPHGLKRIVL